MFKQKMNWCNIALSKIALANDSLVIVIIRDKNGCPRAREKRKKIQQFVLFLF